MVNFYAQEGKDKAVLFNKLSSSSRSIAYLILNIAAGQEDKENLPLKSVVIFAYR